MCLKVQ